jgi:hypothetical protein
MENTFSINYEGREVKIERQEADQYNNTFFTAHFPDGDIQIEYTEDDEGAGRWLDTRTHHQTEFSAELGQLINLYLTQHGITI